MPSIDFAAVKAAVSFEDAIAHLDLKMKQQGKTYRAPCPTCQQGGDRALAVTPGEGFYCHSQRKGGDVIAFVAHVRNCSQREAAAELQERFIGTASQSSHQTTRLPGTVKSVSTGNDDLQPLDHLSTDHPAIEALGLSATACDAIGIGFASKGLMRGRVAFPLRLPDGSLVGYMGLATQADQAPLILFPRNLDEKVAAPPKIETTDDKIVDFKKFYRSAS
jgi:DNA primase